MKQIFSCLLALAALLSFISCEKDNEPINDNTSEPSTGTLQISLDSEVLTLEIGSTAQLVASFIPSDAENKAHEWISSNSEIATVDAKGLVKAVSIGNANIVAKSLATGTTATCKVTVVDKVVMPTSVKFNKTKESILVGETLKLEATVAPDNASDKSVIWSSSVPTIASVDGDGMVRGLLAGTAEITATTVNGKTAKCNISVENPTVEFSNLKISTIDETSAEVSFNITTKGVTLNELGLCYDIDKTPTIESTVVKLDYSKTNLSCNISNLSPNTLYYIRAYAKDDNKTYYSEMSSFKTNDIIKTDFKVTQIYKNKIVCNTPNVSGVNLKVCYGKNPNPKITDYLAKTSKGKDLTTVTLSDLSEATTYFFRAYDIVDGKAIYYENEASASTIGAGGAMFSSTYEDWFASYYMMANAFILIKYNLPEGTYKVTGSKFCNSIPSNIHSLGFSFRGEDLIYVSGEGSFYIVSSASMINGNHNCTFEWTLIFEDIETHMIYIWEDSLKQYVKDY